MGYVGTDVEPPFEKIPMAKIIWHENYYDEAADTVHVVDIWDVRMNPETLILRIK